ncbi:hypothetical protein B0H17DRAFT_1219766 [Mycena rosella]|uniref:Uncharacterized protein n=1 Tax=Mycena rosella TaxID=1033263 RepID=A0AAD7FHI2_MYCRO|nr:hypothetical protein B0H17DRAFT_1219766 [Mycena rosella]
MSAAPSFDPDPYERPHDWGPQLAEQLKQHLDNERPNLKQEWTFPSPFITYAAHVPGSRGDPCWGPQSRTLAELRMYGLSWAIRSKVEWQRKMADPLIMDKWRKEALEQQDSLPVEQQLTPNMVNYVLTELAAYARLSDPDSGIESGPFDAIWYSDRLVSNETAGLLRAAAAELEDVPDDLKDWHPGSNGQVLDLVHPYLYCIVYDRTHSSEGSGSTLLQPPVYDILEEYDYDLEDNSEHYAAHAVSNRFCWLPSDFSVDTTDGSVKLVSPYINNLHPMTHKPLYRLIESDLYRDVTPGSGRIMVERSVGTWAGYNWKLAGITVPCTWSKKKVEYKRGMSEEEYTKCLQDAPKALPEAYEEYTGELEKTIVPYSLRGKTIQCIIKLANIHLTVENPEYKGGSMLNEHIVTSGIYYYEEYNISESWLAFRVNTSPPVYHDQDDEICMEILYGMERYTQHRSWLDSYKRRSCPRVAQHLPASRRAFHLVDPTKPGHRKILAIFLVDPSIEPIPSATNIPPQQTDWAFAALEEARSDPASAFSRLPPELSNVILNRFPDTFMDRKEAEAYRLRLMEERTTFDEAHDMELSNTFNMCEH